MEDLRTKEAAAKFTEAYESVAPFGAAPLFPVGLWAGVIAVLAGSTIYAAYVDEVPSLSTTPHEIAEEVTADVVVEMWTKLRQRLLLTEQRAEQLQARLDAAVLTAAHAASLEKENVK